MRTVYVFTKEGVETKELVTTEVSDYPLGTYAYFSGCEPPWSKSTNRGNKFFNDANWWDDLKPEEVPAEIRAQLLLVM